MRFNWNNNIKPLLFALLMAHVSIQAAEIEWNTESLVLIQERSVYGRMIRLSASELLCSFERDGRSFVTKSIDNGAGWQAPVLVARYEYGAAANPEMLRLSSGKILYFYNERPWNTEHPFSIVLTSIDDSGTTQTAPARLFSTREGCWEPVAIELPGGEIQLFFANEGPYTETNEQEISMMVSRDRGNSWSNPVTISFRAGHRDGMPVPLVLSDNTGMVLAIEDNGLNGRFKPVILRKALGEIWPMIDGYSPRRWSALSQPLAPDVYAGAPYIAQLPCGTTVLSFQSTEGGREEAAAQMVVYLGDCEAKNFTGKSIPFEIPTTVGAKWNSIFVKDEHTITAISSTILDGKWGVWAIDGRVKCCGE